MIHLILSLCRQFEDAFGKAIDGGKGGTLILSIHDMHVRLHVQIAGFVEICVVLHNKAITSLLLSRIACAGGERILQVFEARLVASIRALNFTKLLESENVKRVVEEADGYQPHLVAPEMGYRRLLQECLILFKARRTLHARCTIGHTNLAHAA